jgi:cell division protein ZapA
LEKPIRIKLLDHEYLIRSDEDEERVQNIAQFLDGKLREISQNAEGLSQRKAAILAAFDIASDYFQILKERDDLARNIERRARALNHQIESIVG